MQQLLTDIRLIIIDAQNRVARSINHEKTIAHWQIGERIIIEEQNGLERAKYKDYLLKNLAQKFLISYIGIMLRYIYEIFKFDINQQILGKMIFFEIKKMFLKRRKIDTWII